MEYTGKYAELLQQKNLTIIKKRELSPTRTILTVRKRIKHKFLYYQMHIVKDKTGRITCW